jgi:APA family basic amino acid/polyamine antiporter
LGPRTRFFAARNRRAAAGARHRGRRAAPQVATILTGVFVATVSAFVSIDEMVDLTNIGTLFAFVLVCAGIIVMRYREPATLR